MINTKKFSSSYLFAMLIFICSTNAAAAQWIKVDGGSICCFTHDDTYIYAGHTGGIYIPGDTSAPRNVIRSNDNGVSWENVSNGLVSRSIYSLDVRSLAIKDNKIFVGTNNGIFRSSNHGDSWVRLNFDPSNGVVLCFLVEDSIIFAGAYGGGVFRSSDDGETWLPVNSGLEENYFDKCIYALVKIGSTLFAGSYGGGIFLSANNGDSWTHNYTSSNWQVKSFAVIDSVLFAGLEGDIFRSTNYGTTWVRTDSGLVDSLNDDFFTCSFAVYENIIFAGADLKGIFLSTDLGNSWFSVNDDMQSNPDFMSIYSVVVIGDYIFVGTGFGVYKKSISDITDVKVSSHLLPEEFKLDQNYPNPFNPTTVISYKLTVKSEVGLRIYDILGREIALLVNEVKNAGNHTVEWDGKNSAGEPVGSGIYFYRLTADKYTDVKKMVLIR